MMVDVHFLTGTETTGFNLHINGEGAGADTTWRFAFFRVYPFALFPARDTEAPQRKSFRPAPFRSRRGQFAILLLQGRSPPGFTGNRPGPLLLENGLPPLRFHVELVTIFG